MTEILLRWLGMYNWLRITKKKIVNKCARSKCVLLWKIINFFNFNLIN